MRKSFYSLLNIIVFLAFGYYLAQTNIPFLKEHPSLAYIVFFCYMVYYAIIAKRSYLRNTTIIDGSVMNRKWQR